MPAARSWSFFELNCGGDQGRLIHNQTVLQYMPQTMSAGDSLSLSLSLSLPLHCEDM